MHRNRQGSRMRLRIHGRSEYLHDQPGEDMKRVKLGTKLDLIRRNQEVTVEEYARKCDLPKDTMKRILEGRNAPSGKALIKILKLGGVRLGLLEIDDFDEEGIA